MRRRLLTTPVVLACACALVAGACSGSATSADSVSEGTAEASEATDVAGASEPQVVRAQSTSSGAGEPVTIAFAGDSHFEGPLAPLLGGPVTALGDRLPALGEADLTIVNLETAITTGGTDVGKEFTFSAPPAALELLRAAGVDAVTLANNHGMDFSADGLADSLAAEAALGQPVIGAGATEAEAYEPWVITVRGQRIAVLAATQVLDTQLIDAWTAEGDEPGLASAKREDRLVEAVVAARAEADTVVVFLHWGVERQTCPSDVQRALAPRLAEAGADIVVGSHAHRLQGAGMLDGTFVAYGLGNFLWYNEQGANGDTGILTVTVSGRRIEGWRWDPARITDGVPQLLEGEAAEAARADFEALRGCTGLAGPETLGG